MLEIPESHTIAKQMAQAVSGRTVESVDVNRSPHRFAFYFKDPAGYPSILTGHRIVSARADGGMPELLLDGCHLAFTDGARPRLLAADEPVPKKHQLCLTLDDGSHIVTCVQMYGGMFASADGCNDNQYYLAAKEKPSPLSAAFDLAYFNSLFEGLKPTTSVKALLAAEQRIPGLGNGVLQDILFRAHLHPKTWITSLSSGQREALFESIRSTLADMTEAGGRETEPDFFGNHGGYHTILSSKTHSEPCPVCGTAIVRQNFLGGKIYFCPTCQPQP